MNTALSHKSTALISAVQNCCELGVEFLIRSGADVNKYHPNRYTALMEAVKLGKTKCVHTLIKGGADVNLKCKRNYSPLMLATDLSNAHEIMKLLIDAGADVNATNSVQLGTSKCNSRVCPCL